MPIADTAMRWNTHSGQGSSPFPYCSHSAQPISPAQTRKPNRYASLRGGSSSSAADDTPSAITAMR